MIEYITTIISKTLNSTLKRERSLCEPYLLNFAVQVLKLHRNTCKHPSYYSIACVHLIPLLTEDTYMYT